MRKLAKAKARDLKENPFRVRANRRSPAELFSLGTSVIQGQQTPLIWTPDLVVRDGDERRAGVMLINPDFELEGIETDEDIDPSEIQLITATQKNLDPFSMYTLMAKWREEHPEATLAALAERVGLDNGTVSKILSFSRCIAPVQELAAAGALGMTEWYAFAKESPERQHELLAMRLEGKVTGRDGLERQRRKARNGNGSAKRTSKVAVPLPGGRKLVISGEALGMMDVVDVLSETLKQARKDADTYDVKTWVKMMADKARG